MIAYSILAVLGLLLYLLPTWVAAVRGHPNAAPIAVINVLLGWSLVGWAVALAWSVSYIDPETLPGPQRRVNPKRWRTVKAKLKADENRRIDGFLDRLD
jgi:hypothetical protein